MFRHCTTYPAISYFATKSQQSTDADYKNALRVLSYLKETSAHGITIHCQELKLHLHCNASWASHDNDNIHIGWILRKGHILPMKKWQTESGVALINRRRNNRYR